MALLHSLKVRGVRSFDPDSDVIVMFNTPVTLFLGQNGSGKTTIIEAIRFALTGELPGGTSSGQGFVNDPKITNRSQTKANVLIKFTDCHGYKNTVARYMQVASKPSGGLTFKNINYNLRRYQKGDSDNYADLSGRCADINSYCSEALNVSKSILNNVLFCHQENSTWPLDEPKKLKEKFDEVFDASKYNKCAETLRKVIKEEQGLINTLKARLDSKKLIKERVDKDREKLNVKRGELNEIKQKIQNKQEQMKPLQDRMERILALEDQLGTLERTLAQYKAEKTGFVDQQTNLKRNISYIFEGDDEALQAKIDSFAIQEAKISHELTELTNKKTEIIAKATQVTRDIQKIQMNIGKLKEEKKQHLSKIEEIATSIDKLRISLGLPDDIVDKDNRDVTINNLVAALSSSQELYEQMVREMDTEEENLQKLVDKVNQELATTKADIATKTRSVEETEKKLRETRVKLREIEASDVLLKNISNKVEKLQTDLEKVKSNFNESEKRTEIEEISDYIETKEKYLDKLYREHRILQDNYVIEQKLEDEKNSIIEKESDIHKMKLTHSHDLGLLFGDDIPERNFKSEVLAVQSHQSTLEKQILANINRLERELTTAETTRKHLKKKLEEDKKDLTAKQKKVSNLCGPKEFDKVLEQSYNKTQGIQKEKGVNQAAKIMFEAFIHEFTDKPKKCCPVCHTDFSEKPPVIKQIVAELNNKITHLPARLKELEATLKKEEDIYNKLQQLKPVNDEIILLSEVTIPSLEKELMELEERHENLSLDLATERASLIQPKEKLEACKNFLSDATLLDQYICDVVKSKRAIEQLQQNLVTVSSNRSRQETEAEIDEVKADLSSKKNRYNSCKDILDRHRERCQQLVSNIQAETQKQINMPKLVQQKPLLEERLKELNEDLTSLKSKIETLNDEAAEQKQRKWKAEEEKQLAVQKNRAAKQKASTKISEDRNALRNIQKLQDILADYERKDVGTKLKDIEAQLEERTETNRKLEETKNKITDIVLEKNGELAKQETNLRALNDNKNLRELQKREEEASNKISKLEEEIGGYNYRAVYAEKQKIERGLEKMKREINTYTGQGEEIEKIIKEIDKELNTEESKMSYRNYQKQFYELTVVQYAIQDALIYANRLEKAILKFHEERMVQINRTIRELWMDIYTGNDIDYIEIKTDESLGTGKRRTYNYKVVQVKSNIELEMRGRCSAGQKVVACLVIRMALAETFSSTCGILALDEPTTNLDHENICSLSDALTRIVTNRQNQKNFQLLVITHDEDFLQCLHRSLGIEEYWKVSRDRNGFSRVNRNIM